MSRLYNADEYIYCTTRVRVLENNLIGNEKLSHLLEARNVDEVFSRLAEYGVNIERNENGRADAEKTLEGILDSAFELCDKDAPDPWRFTFLHRRYDCVNIKAAIKCAARGIDPAPMMTSGGAIPPETIIKAVSEKNYDLLPEIFAKAARMAVESYLGTGNPQFVDIILDKACFEDMLLCSKRAGVKFFGKLTVCEIDTLNVIMSVRVFRMHGGREFLEDSLIDGGKLGKDVLVGAYLKGQKEIADSLKGTDYEKLCALIAAEDTPLYLIERAADDIRMELLHGVKNVISGADAIAAYIAAVEYEVKNLRILIAGKLSGLDAATIRERMRASYV